MDKIEKALKRFNSVLDALECECDHSDKILVNEALSEIIELKKEIEGLKKEVYFLKHNRIGG